MEKTKGILVVSYGSSYKEEREKSIGAIEMAIATAFPEYKVYRAFTSKSIVERIWKKEGVRIDSIGEALERALAEGIRKMIVLQTHLAKGVRFDTMEQVAMSYDQRFEQLKILQPILSNDEMVGTFVDGLISIGTTYDDGATTVCFVGHGMDDDSETIYGRLQNEISKRGYPHFYIGTLSMKPTCKDLVECIGQNKEIRNVVLVPLMLVSGYHVRKDLMGAFDDSWCNTFLRAGFSVECIKRGLGEASFLQNIFIEYLKNVIL